MATEQDEGGKVSDEIIVKVPEPVVLKQHSRLKNTPDLSHMFVMTFLVVVSGRVPC